jgi:segregation and condensation protein B
MQHLVSAVEALIFSSDHAISIEDIKSSIELATNSTVSKVEIEEAIQVLFQIYNENVERSIEILFISGGYRFMTKPAFQQYIGAHLKLTSKRKLSQVALETLSIVAYRQPVSKTDLESIRGVSCDYAIQKLLEKELIAISGRSEAAGRPLLYSTSEKFMDYFGLGSLKDLPKIKDFKQTDNMVGEEIIEEIVEN